MSLKLNTKYLEGFVSEHEYEGMAAQVTAAHNTLVNRNGLGNDFLGWVTLPEDYDKEEFARIKAAAARIKEKCDVLIVIGIGGSYLGARAAMGTLKQLSDEEGYETFVVPDDVGGRFSVLTAVGLLPIAAAGCDIDKLMAGAREGMKKYSADDNNDCYKYAALRNILYRKGKSVEMLVSYDPSFTMMGEWFKQLFGESEGKDDKGIFPSAATFSTDLHSLGQFIQDGSKLMFETVMHIKTPKSDLFLEPDKDNLDGLNFLTNQNMSVVNEKAYQGTILAHTEGGVPNIVIDVDKLDEENLGEMIYFFEKACAISGYMLGVNPFNQPGVESYKKNMFALLGKPGYESQKAELEAKLG